MIFAFASDRHVFINELFGDERSFKLLERASESLDDLFVWVNHAMDLMRNFDKTNANRDNPVERTKTYIQLHLSEEVSMEQIANHVHLNADYLTRIFKKEVGVSISRYLINKKWKCRRICLFIRIKASGKLPCWSDIITTPVLIVFSPKRPEYRLRNSKIIIRATCDRAASL